MGVVGMLVLTTIGGWILYAIMSAGVKAPGASLNQKFVSLGTLKGKTLNEITSVVGQPNAVSAMAGGKVLRQ